MATHGWRAVCVASLGLAVAVGCTAEPGRTVTAGEFGDAWPFTVRSGRLNCVAHGQITFRWRGTEYTLNGDKEHGAYSGVGPIWADAPGGGKKPLAPVVDRGRQLC